MANYMENWPPENIRAEIKRLAREEYYEIIREQNRIAFDKELAMTAIFGEGLDDKPRSEVKNPTQTWTVEMEDLIELSEMLKLRPWQQDRLYYWVDHLEKAQEARRNEGG